MSRLSFAGCLAVLISCWTAPPLPAQTEEIQERVAQRLLAAQALAGPDQAADGKPTPLLVTPARLTAPVLRFALLPELRDQVPGDAGPIYKKVGELLQKTPADDARRNKLRLSIDQWLQVPSADLPREEALKALEVFKEPLALLEKAARCENCDWGLSQKLRQQGLSIHLEVIQQLRDAAKLLGLKARLELAANRPDRALRTLQVLYQIGHRVSGGPTLICSLAGIGITGIANRLLEEVVAHPQAPNLYWSLTNLPRPFADMRQPFQGERLMVYGNFPGMLAVVNDLQAGPLTEEQVRKTAEMVMVIDARRPRALDRLHLATQIRDKHETAKKALITAGRPRDKVESWPHLQVALMHALLEYDQVFDEVLKWQTFPHYEIQPALEQFDRKFEEVTARGPDAPALPLALMLLPATQKMLVFRARLERSFAALRCVEALRLHVAGMGKLPASLNDVTEVPIPVCPITGKPFEYLLKGDKALLTAPEVPTRVGNVQPLAYELTLRR